MKQEAPFCYVVFIVIKLALCYLYIIEQVYSECIIPSIVLLYEACAGICEVIFTALTILCIWRRNTIFPAY